MIKHVKVGIITTNQAEGNVLKGMLKDVADIKILYSASWSPETPSSWEDAGVDVYILSSDSEENLFSLCAQVSATFPTCGILLVNDNAGEGVLRKSMQAGAMEVLSRPFMLEDLTDAIYSTAEISKRKRSLVKTKQAKTIQVERKAEIISVFSSKGGTGKTFIAANLAVALAERKKRVCIIDLHLSGSGVHLALDVSPEFTIVDVAHEVNRLDFDLLSGYLVSHKSELKVLAAPNKPEFEGFISPEAFEKIIKVLVPEFDYVLIDCGTALNELVLTVLQFSDLKLLVGVPDILAIKNLKTAVNLLDSLGHSKTGIMLVINRLGKNSGISSSQIEKTMELPVSAFLPEEPKTAYASINEGLPVVSSMQRSQLGKKLKELSVKVEQRGRSRVSLEKSAATQKGKVTDFSAVR